MRRREFITLIGGAAATLGPGIARAQQPAMPVIGFLGNERSLDPRDDRLADIRGGLSETGYVEGRNLAIEYRWAENRYERLPALAADLVHRRVARIIATTTPSALAAKAETDSIPIVFQIAGDPVRIGLVVRLNRPGGNLTGITNLFVEAAGKRLELLKEVVPAVLSMALLTNLTNPVFAEPEASELQAAVRILGVRLLVLSASHRSEFEAAFATIVRDGAGALLIGGELGGHIMLQASGMEWKPSVDAGQMRLLIMGTPTRHPSYPDVPTLLEAGFPFDIEVPFGLIGPNGMDSVIVARLHDAFKKANEVPSIVLLYTKFDIIPRYATGEDFRKLFETIHADMKPVIEGLGLQRKE